MSFLIAIPCGCGGGGTKEGDAPSGDALVGNWSGTYSQSDANGVSGTTALTIVRTNPSDHQVEVRGTAVDTERGAGTVTGFFTDRGQTGLSKLYIDFPASPTQGPVPSRLLSGQFRRDGRGHLVGTLAMDLGDFTSPLGFDLSPVP